MIVQPEFPEHWKTRLLINITSDESSPLAVIRLWAYCQTSRRWEFPNMTPKTLAAICRWDEREPECHVALCEAGFLDKLDGGGFAAHDWHEANAQLIQKWEAGKKGGRPPKEETDRFQPVSRVETDRLDLTDRKDSEKAYKASPTKASKRLNGGLKVIADQLEDLLGVQWINDAGKWIVRIKKDKSKMERVVAEVANAVRESRITSSPAQYAEDTWKRFK